MELGEGLKKILLVGIGTAAVTAEKSKEILDELVKKGEGNDFQADTGAAGCCEGADRAHAGRGC